jgi:hypothetical protein
MGCAHIMIKNPKAFDNNPPANFDGLFSWEYLNQFFPRGIEFSDIDAVVEIGGLILMIETKHPGKIIPNGQKGMYEVFLNMPNVKLLCVWGKMPDTVTRLEIHDGLGTPKVIDPATSFDVIRAVNDWVSHAEWLNKQTRKRLNYPWPTS